MPSLDFTLDTGPMARSLDQVTNHVTLTTGAVSAMELAVIKAEKDSADMICQNVDRGFYNLIRSQVSSKLATHFTSMNASFMLLMQYAKTLGATQNRMEADISRLKRQYYKIFHGLDKSLDNRVAQLDKDAVQLSRTGRNLITERKRKNVTSAVLSQQDTENLTKALVTARLKERAGAALDSIHAKISGDSRYANQVSEVLQQQEIESQESLHVPVIMARERSQVTATAAYPRAYLPEYLDPRTGSVIEDQVDAALPQVLDSVGDTSHQEPVAAAFRGMVEQSDTDPRVKAVMLWLYEGRRTQ